MLTCFLVVILLIITPFTRAQSTPVQSFWPAAVPLAVHSPYFSLWLPTQDGVNPLNVITKFWNGSLIGPIGLVRVDGTTYQWLGAWRDQPEASGINLANLTGIQITPTRSILAVQVESIMLNVTYLTPIEPSDWVRQSMPFSYVAMEVSSIDGQPHDIQVYFDVDGGWMSGDNSAVVKWNLQSASGVTYHEIQLNTSSTLQETPNSNRADYGSMYHAMANRSDMTYRMGGSDANTRDQFQTTGSLDNSVNTTFRAISDNVVFAFAVDLGLTSSTSSPVVWTIGYVQDPAIAYTTPAGQTQDRSPYFVADFSDASGYVPAFVSDYDAASQRAQALDQKILQDASGVSSDYADLVSLAARQVLGAIDITISNGSDGQFNTSDTMIFMKDIGNTGRVSPVEVLYQAFPMFLYLNSSLGKPLLAPLLEYQDSPLFTVSYAASDLGSSYPVASEDSALLHQFGIEQTGNMLIMTLAHARTSGDGSLIAQYYTLLRRWSMYLVNNTLYPTTDQESADFESIANNTNLALKGIIGVGAMAEMSRVMGQTEDAELFSAQAKSLIGQWTSLALSPDQKHILLDYSDDSSWALVYNLYADRLLGLNLVDSSIYEKQTSFYSTLSNSTYGLGIDSDHANIGNSAWLLFTAATATDSVSRNSLVSMARSHASFNGTSTVFPTIYDTSQGTTLGGTASPGQGAMFALLALNVPNTTIAVPSSTTSGTNTSSPASTIPAKKKTSIGAIIGGVVGGLCVIGVAVAAALMWMHRSRKLTRTHEKAQDILAEPEPFIYNTVPQFPSSYSIDNLQSVSVPSGPAQVVEASAFHSMHLPSKVQERIVYNPSTRHPTPAASAISGASRSPVTSNGGSGYANSAGPGGSISTTDVQELRTQVENLQRVVQGIQLDNMEPPPVYMG